MSDYINHNSDVVIPRLEKRIAELEAQVEALTSKPTIVRGSITMRARVREDIYIYSDGNRVRKLEYAYE